MKTYGVKMIYSWGEEEPVVECGTRKEAWEKAEKLAFREAEIASMEHDCKICLFIHNQPNEQSILLHYTYDDTYCRYVICEV